MLYKQISDNALTVGLIAMNGEIVSRVVTTKCIMAKSKTYYFICRICKRRNPEKYECGQRPGTCTKCYRKDLEIQKRECARESTI